MSRPNNLERIKSLQDQLLEIEFSGGNKSNTHIRLKTQLNSKMKKLPKYNSKYLKRYGL